MITDRRSTPHADLHENLPFAECFLIDFCFIAAKTARICAGSPLPALSGPVFLHFRIFALITNRAGQSAYCGRPAPLISVIPHNTWIISQSAVRNPADCGNFFQPTCLPENKKIYSAWQAETDF